MIFEDKYAQLKQAVTDKINSLSRLPRSDQADLIIIEINKNIDSEDWERLLTKYKRLLTNHIEKEILVYSNNKFFEVINV